DVGRAHAIAQSHAGLIARIFFAANHAECFYACAECSKVRSNVSRAAEALTLLNKIHDRHSGFWGEARCRAPKVAVQHEVAEDADALAAQFWDKSSQAGNGRSKVARHMFLRFS